MNVLLLFVMMAAITTETLNFILIGLILAALIAIAVLLYITLKLRKQHIAHDHRVKTGIEVKTAFIKHIGQELRLPLNTINELCQELEDATDGKRLSVEKREALIQDIHSNSHLLNTYLNELQELTGFSGKVPAISMIEVNLAELVASYRREILHEVHRGVTVGVYTNLSHHCKALLDTPMFRQLMIHLLRICAQHTKEGSISISYEWENEGLRFRIEDTGGGLPEKYKAVVFKDEMPKGLAVPHEYRLIAVSMSICKSIIDAMHGTITCYSSEEEKGIVLDFWVPCYVRFD